MNTLNERIKKLRKALDLTQQEFADRLSIKRNTVATYERGKSDPSDAAVVLICKTFNVSETWLRTGEGEMFVPKPAFDLGEYASQHRMTALETEILKAYLDLDSSVRESLLQHFKERLTHSVPAVNAETVATAPAAGKDICAPPAPGASIQEKTEAELEAEADAFAAMAREQFLAEFKKESPISSVIESDVG